MTTPNLDVFRGCGDHVYHNADCPHCRNNSALVDMILAHFGERREQEPEKGTHEWRMWEHRTRTMSAAIEELAAWADDPGCECSRVICQHIAKKIAAILTAQAAAHGESVRELQVRMVAMKEVVERTRAYLVVVGNDDAELDALVDSLAAYDALLAETNGR